MSEAHLYGGDGVGRLDDGACAEEPTVRGNVERLRGGLVFRAHRLLYHSTLGSRLIKTEKTLAGYRGTSLIRTTPLLGPYSRIMHRVMRWSLRKGLFLMSEVFL